MVAKRNARERRRVQAVNSAFAKLRKCVPLENRSKRLSKVKTLQKAIEYIEELKSVLGTGDSSFEEDDHSMNIHEHGHLSQVESALDSSSSSYTSNSLLISEYDEFASQSNNNSSSFNTTADQSSSFNSIEDTAKISSSAINVANSTNNNNNNVTSHGYNDNLMITVLDPYNHHVTHPNAQTVLHHHIPIPPHSHHQWYPPHPSVEPIYNWTNSWLDKQQS